MRLGEIDRPRHGCRHAPGSATLRSAPPLSTIRRVRRPQPPMRYARPQPAASGRQERGRFIWPSPLTGWSRSYRTTGGGRLAPHSATPILPSVVVLAAGALRCVTIGPVSSTARIFLGRFKDFGLRNSQSAVRNKRIEPLGPCLPVEASQCDLRRRVTSGTGSAPSIG